MTETKQILVVDDHFEMLEFLRSMLELSNQGYEVVGVPSAEEGFLELRRTDFDLLITDLRLPGMSGFDLVRKVKAIRPALPIIMITAYSSDEGRQEAVDLGVARYFPKPLDTDSLLAAVGSAIRGEPLEIAAPAALPPHDPVLEEETPVPVEVRQRLESLRADTGASQLFLAAAHGHVRFRTEGNAPLPLEKLAVIIASNLATSFQLAEQLDSDEPFTIQYQSGQNYDLYSANVGRDHFIAMLFDAQLRRGRIGTVWVFAQRAIRELIPLLAAPEPADDDAETAIVDESDAPAASAAPVEPEPAEIEADAPPPPVEEDGDDPVETEKMEETPPAETLEETPLSPEAVAEFEALFGNDDSVDLDDFWEEAIASVDGVNTSGLSFEEALAKGLISLEEEEQE